METIMKPVLVKFVVDNGKEMVASDLTEILVELEGCDGIGSAMNIHNDEIKDYLETMGVIIRTTRGSYRVKDEVLREELLDKLYNM
jgi:hypothetical protein